MNAAPVYSIRRLRKRYGASFELAVESLDVARGEVLCLLGPTGAGKSTLLTILAALETAADGEVTMSGAGPLSPDAPLAVRRQIVMVHQRPHLLAGSVRYNVEYGLRIRGSRDAVETADALMRRLGIDSLASQSSRELSGGQVQLVALARALAVEPAVLLLDEPTSNLDPARVAMVERLVLELQRENQMTVIWTTHNLFQSRRVASRIGLLWDGSLIEVAGKEEFFHAPVDPRTADFVEGRVVF